MQTTTTSQGLLDHSSRLLASSDLEDSAQAFDSHIPVTSLPGDAARVPPSRLPAIPQPPGSPSGLCTHPILPIIISVPVTLAIPYGPQLDLQPQSLVPGL